MKQLFLLFCCVALSLASPHHDHDHGNGDGHAMRWEKHRHEWKELRDTINTIAEQVDHIHDDLGRNLLHETPTYMTAVETVGAVSKENDAKHNMKIIFQSDRVTKIVDEDGEVLDVNATQGSAITTVMKKFDPEFKVWHRIRFSDTTIFWHFGSPIKIHTVDVDGQQTETLLGDIFHEKGAQYATHVTDDVFFAFEVMDSLEDSYGILSLACAPGWRQENHVELPLEEIDGSWYKGTEAVKKHLEEDN